jgi:hypothetical protein
MNGKFKLPVVKGKQSNYPKDFVCPWCMENKVGEPHSMAILSGGAVSQQDSSWYEKKWYAGPTKGLWGGLGFTWHGAHDGGEGEYRETGVGIDIARSVEGGLFTLMFCSVKCMRAFINSCLDEFECEIVNLKPLT